MESSLGRNASPSSSTMIALTRAGATKLHGFTSLKLQSVNVTATVLHYYSIRFKDHNRCCSSPILASREPVQVDLEEPISESENRALDETDSTVRVRFLLQKKCSYGEHFVLVGNDSKLGSWDPDCGIPLDWSDGHLWNVELDMPVGRTIKYKFILKANGGKLHWQPDPDRVLQTRRTTAKAIVVLEDWVDPHVQKIVEEEEEEEQIDMADEHHTKPDAADSGWQQWWNLAWHRSGSSIPPVIKSHILEADSVFQESETGSDVNDEQTGKDDAEPVAESGLLSVTVSMNAITTREKPVVLSLVADNISSHQEEIITSYNENARHQVLVGESITASQPKEEHAVLLSPSNGNGRPLPAVTNSTSIDIEGTLIPEEDVVPVLVPGLSLVPVKKEEMLEDMNASSKNDGFLENYMRYMQKLLSNIALVTGFIVKKKT